MNYLIFIFVVLIQFWGVAQGDEAVPLSVNTNIYKGKENIAASKVNEGTFDSTFIFTADTLTLPLFDDFSTNKFQIYNYDPLAAGVTSILEYKLLYLDDSPVENDKFYTQQATFRRVFNISEGTFVDQPFIPDTIQIGDQTSYPTSYSTELVYPPFRIYDTIDYPNDPDTIWFSSPDVYQDSARQFFATLNDKDAFWLETEAYHNYTFAENPWTIGVVTFDGLDETGYPYAIGTTTSNYADHLTSKPIDLSANSPADSIYLSFLYQPQGFGDKPESGDSLLLEFYNKLTDTWNEVWRGGGTASEDFKVGHILLDDTDYFNDYFQFRFVNYGALSGMLDIFNLDYVNLRTLSGYQDTLFKDFAMVYPVTTLLKDYTSVPWEHYQNNFSGKMSDNVKVTIRNGSNQAENNSVAGTVDVLYSGIQEGAFPLPGSDLANGDLNYGPRTTYTSFHDFSSGYHFDETKLGDSQEFDIRCVASAQYPNFTGNDTTYSKQIFSNYYSYDDGTAELAYGTTGVQSRLAVKYTPYEADSLVGAMISFVPHVYDASNKLFILTVWNDDNGEPGNVIYEDDAFFPRSPEYLNVRDGFTYYLLRDSAKLFVDGTFYIGWRQFETERLHVGLDVNIDNTDKIFFSTDSELTWDNSTVPGSVMIRPIFSTALDYTLGIEKNIIEEHQFTLYPNPTRDIVRVEGDNYEGVTVYNLQGQLILSTSEREINLSEFENGVYVFKAINSEKVYKIIKY